MARNKAVATVRIAALSATFVLVMLAFSACKDSVEMSSDWIGTPISIDGSTADWGDVNTRYFQDQGAVVGIANDSSNLYLLVRFRDPQWVGLIKRTGLKLEFKTDADDNSPFTLVYRGGPNREQLREFMGGMGDKDSGGRTGGPPGGMGERNESMGEPPSGGPTDDQLGGDRREFTCAIDDRIEEKAIPVDGSEGPRAAFHLEEGLFSYEFAVPLDHGGVRSYGLGIGASDKLQLDASWGDPGEMASGTRGSGGPPGGGMGGGPPGGGMGGGMGGSPPGGGGGGMGGGMGGPPGGGGRGQTLEKQEVTFKIQLSGGGAEKDDAEEN